MTFNVDQEARTMLRTSIEDAVSSAPHHSVAVLEAACRLEKRKHMPRMTLVMRLRTEIRRKQRAAALAPKDAA